MEAELINVCEKEQDTSIITELAGMLSAYN